MNQNWQIISGKQEIEDIHKRVIIDVESLIHKFNSNPEPVKELW